MTTTTPPIPSTDEILDLSSEEATPPALEAPKPQIPVQKFSRFGPQAMQAQGNKFWSVNQRWGFNPPSKQRAGRAAGRGR